MELLRFGHDGEPAMVFPTSMGRFYEFEDRGMIGAVSDRIEAGQVQFYCVDSLDAESWYNRHVHPRQRVERYLQYEQYLLQEVIPFIRLQTSDRQDTRIAVTGCSLGAFQAAEIAFRHPVEVKRLLALSGKYENSSFLDGYSDTETYFTNPLAFLRGLSEPQHLDPLRAMIITIVSGSTDPHIDEARQVSAVLWEKGVPNTLDIWDGWVHDWPYWRAMISKHL
jgi:esterase/lipase superfamily enzyme